MFCVIYSLKLLLFVIVNLKTIYVGGELSNVHFLEVYGKPDIADAKTFSIQSHGSSKPQI